jgi:hypothetical protein
MRGEVARLLGDETRLCRKVLKRDEWMYHKWFAARLPNRDDERRGQTRETFPKLAITRPMMARVAKGAG